MSSVSTTNVSTSVPNTADDSAVIICSTVMACVLVPINCFLIAILCRRCRALFNNPMCWLFLNVAFSDSTYLIVHASWYYFQRALIVNPSLSPPCAGLDLFLRISERMLEFVSSCTTLYIALLRAFSVWRSTQRQRIRMAKSHAFIALALIWIGGFAVPGSVILTTCGEAAPCVVMPMYGDTERYHSLLQLLLINLPLVVAYIYICAVLCRAKNALPATCLQGKGRTHSKTIIYLIIYMLLYTLLAGGVHVYFVAYPGACLSGNPSGGSNDAPLVLEILFPLSACGFNPLLLYALSSAIRNSINEIITQLRGCSVSLATEEETM